MDLIIRPFAAEDLSALEAIRRDAFEPVFRSFREIVGEQIYPIALADADREQAELLDSLCAPGSTHQLFVAAIDDRIVGFVSWSLDRDKHIGEIGLNAIHPSCAGQGIGTRLYDFALARMKESGMQVATVGTGGDASHAPARRAYEKAGFGPGIPSLYLYRML
jgi:GNAT superfamily N-acetyltransferase